MYLYYRLIDITYIDIPTFLRNNDFPDMWEM